MSWRRKDPVEICGGKHTNATLDFHECICKFDYSRQKSYLHALKFKHCLLADEMRRIDNFELYVIIAVVVGVVLIFGIAAFCSCKWYLQTNDNPCWCLSCFSCKKKKKKKKNEVQNTEGEIPHNVALENGNQAWTPIRLVPNKDTGDGTLERHRETTETRDHDSRGFCMKFCLSDPVQDCCEFFDCDIMWRKKSIYTIPIFGRRRQPPLQRRPTRPAPPPPKPSLSVPPMVKHPEPMHVGYDDDEECEPVPEAPPSPEPVRIEQPRAMYVDPLAFLQRPFLKSTKEKATDEEPEALYSKMKGFVFGKAKKSSSIASLNKLGVSTNPDTVSNTSSKKSKYSRTGSLASLHNLSDEQLDASYHNKRSMSLASLHMVEEESPKRMIPKGLVSKLLMARSRGSLHNICEDDVPPSLRTDEYIDLEEMTKRIEAKMQAAHEGTLGKDSTSTGGVPNSYSQAASSGSNSWTPNFIPASSYDNPSKMGEVVPSYSSDSHQISPRGPQQRIPLGFESQYGSALPYKSIEVASNTFVEETANSKFFPAVPATPDRPAVPARIAVGTPVVNTGTLGRPKPAVPPRPPGSGSNSPKPRAPQPPTLGRSSHVVKPSAPPPPPPVTTPIESSL